MPNTNGLIECNSVMATGDPSSSFYVGKAITAGTMSITSVSSESNFIWGGDLATFTFEPDAIYLFCATFLLTTNLTTDATYGSIQLGPQSGNLLSYGGVQFSIPPSLSGQGQFVSVCCALSTDAPSAFEGSISLSTPANIQSVTITQPFLKRIA